MQININTTVDFEYTNTCTCKDYDEDTDNYVDSRDCYGDCWDFVIDDFTNVTKHLFNQNPTNWWKVSNLRLWNGDVSGYFSADSPIQLIRSMSVDSEWIMRGNIFDDRIEYSLSHHDAPMGSSSVLTMVTEDEVERLGLV